jgi:hypothetical protein
MPRKRTKKVTPPKSILGSDILRDKIWKRKDKVYFLLFPYSDPDLIQVFEGQIMSSRVNKDLTREYEIRITCGFDKRENLKNFFYRNWFKTPNVKRDMSIYENFDLPFNDNCTMFNYIESEFSEEINNDKYFKFSNYKTFFKNYTNQFIFSVNEAFIFDELKDAYYYFNILSWYSIVTYLRKMHNVMINDLSNIAHFKIAKVSTADFVMQFKHIIVQVIRDAGKDFEHYLETDEKIVKFFRSFILLHNVKDIHNTKSKKRRAMHNSKFLINRERLNKTED